MYLQFEDNPNCGFVEDRVLKHQGEPQRVEAVLRRVEGVETWCGVLGVDAGGKSVPAFAVKVEDSGEGTCWLVYGGRWGLRLSAKPSFSVDLSDPTQWGEGFLLLPPDGQDLRLAGGLTRKN